MVGEVIQLCWRLVPYRMRVLTDEPTGKVAYQIGAEEALTDRFHRVYIIKAEPDGRPKTCSCPHFAKAKDTIGLHPYCKHLQMVEAWWRKNTEAGKDAQALLEQQAVAAGFYSMEGQTGG